MVDDPAPDDPELPGTPESRKADADLVRARIADTVRRVRKVLGELLQVIRDRFQTLPLRRRSERHRIAIRKLHNAADVLGIVLADLPRTPKIDGRLGESVLTWDGLTVPQANLEDYISAVSWLREAADELKAMTSEREGFPDVTEIPEKLIQGLEHATRMLAFADADATSASASLKPSDATAKNGPKCPADPEPTDDDDRFGNYQKRIAERLQIAKDVIALCANGTFPTSDAVYQLKIGAWMAGYGPENQSDETPIYILNELGELGRVSQTAIIDLAELAACDAERLVTQIPRGDSIEWAKLRRKCTKAASTSRLAELQTELEQTQREIDISLEIATKPDTEIDDARAARWQRMVEIKQGERDRIRHEINRIKTESVPAPPPSETPTVSPSTIPAPRDNRKGKTARKRMSKAAANDKAMKLAKADTSFAKAPTARRWAKEIGCSTGLVVELPFWLKCKKELGKSEHPKKPKAVALTDTLAATIGQSDPELARLIGEQVADFEPSPLDASHRPRCSRRPSV